MTVSPDPHPRVRRLLILGAVSALLSACAGPVSIPEADVDATTRHLCEQLVADLPPTVHGMPQRDTTGTVGAAWGDPPITLNCGIPRPTAMATDPSCFEVDGVGWFAQEGEGGFLFTTIGRAVHVQVGVPSRYAPEAEVLVDLADVVDAHNPEHLPCM